MTNKTVTMSRELAERLALPPAGANGWTSWNTAVAYEAAKELRSLLAAPVVERQPEGQRERFQKWVLATKHPVLGFLDGNWLERGDDREGYANEYVQGLWVAFKAFTSPPAPIAVRKLEMADVVRAHMEIPNCPVMTSNQCHALAVKLNACLDKVKELNSSSVCCGSCPGGCVIQAANQ